MRNLEGFCADMSPWNLMIKAVGMPRHRSRMYSGSAMENLMKRVEVMSRFRENEFCKGIKYTIISSGLARACNATELWL